MRTWFVYNNGEWVDTIDCPWYLDENGVKQTAIEWFGHTDSVVVVKKG